MLRSCPAEIEEVTSQKSGKAGPEVSTSGSCQHEVSIAVDQAVAVQGSTLGGGSPGVEGSCCRDGQGPEAGRSETAGQVHVFVVRLQSHIEDLRVRAGYASQCRASIDGSRCRDAKDLLGWLAGSRWWVTVPDLDSLPAPVELQPSAVHPFWRRHLEIDSLSGRGSWCCGERGDQLTGPMRARRSRRH